MAKLSVVIASFNEEAKIKACLSSVEFADEVIVVDGSSEDKTKDIAEDLGAKVFIRENNLMLNVNKNFGFSRAENEWILNLDADERVTEELRDEILEVLKDDPKEISAFSMPRKNIIFGKWIKHTGWYPDRQIRLFRKNRGEFSQVHVHEQLDVDGKIADLENPIYHESYRTITEFLMKFFIIYAPNEAKVRLNSKDYKFHASDFIQKPFTEFINRYYYHKGYADGLHGLALSLLMAFYHFVVVCMIWEKKDFVDNGDSSSAFADSVKTVKKDLSYWENTTNEEKTKNPLRKIFYRTKRKISSI